MGRYVLSRDIHAPAASVFKAFTEPALAADWLRAAGIRNISGSLDQPGSTYTLIIGGPHRFRSTVVRSEPPLVHETVHRGPFGQARMVARLSERDGTTHLELTTEYALPFGALGRWLDRRFVDHEPRTSADREIDRLVELVSTAA